MKRLLYLGSVLLLATLLITACSDDEDCPTCPDGSQTGIITGYLSFEDGGIHGYAMIVGMDGRLPAVDSVVVDGEKADLQASYSSGMPIFNVDIGEGGMIMGSAAKPATVDSIPFRVYTPGGVSTAYCAVMEYPEDRPVVIVPDTASPYDTVAINDPINVIWHYSDAPEWFLVTYSYSYDSAGTTVYGPYTSHWTLSDTTFSISGANTGFNGRYYMNVVGATGPNPDDAVGSFTGGTIRGVVASGVNESFTVYVGTGQY
ncbi:MAG: hypothetical protein KKA42_16730 [candidate division Zixibacteria bacterium]|nr:hypothetical protein [candidate division Zixibacteria bacterium]